MRSSPVDVTTMPKVPDPAEGAPSASFEIRVEGGTPVVTPLYLAGRMEGEFDTVISEETVKVARGERQRKTPTKPKRLVPYP